MTPDQALNYMRKVIVSTDPAPGNQKRFAEKIGVSDAYISMVLNGRKEPSDALLDAFGLVRTKTVTYRRKAT